MGLIACISICVVVILFSMFCSSCEVCEFSVNVAWLCIHIMDVSDGSAY